MPGGNSSADASSYTDGPSFLARPFFSCIHPAAKNAINPGVWGRAPININYEISVTGHQDKRIVFLEIN